MLFGWRVYSHTTSLYFSLVFPTEAAFPSTFIEVDSKVRCFWIHPSICTHHKYPEGPGRQDVVALPKALSQEACSSS